MHNAPRRTRKAAILALLSAVLAPAALGVGSQSASAEPSDHVNGSYIECGDHLWDARWNIDDTDPHIAYSGYWRAQAPMQGQWWGTHHITNEGGAKASFQLPYGAYYFALGFTKMRNAGLAAIYYNGQLIRELDMYAPVNVADCALVFETLPPGTLTVKAVNRKNPASGGTNVNVDYVHYET